MIIFALIFALVVLPSSVIAHGLETEQSVVVGRYTVEFSYDAPKITAGELIAFTLRLADNDTGDPVIFDDVFFRVTSPTSSMRGTMFAGAVSHASFGEGIARMSITVPAGGDYEASLRFEKDGKTLAEADFPLVALENSGQSGSAGGVIALLGAFFGGAASAIIFVQALKRK